MREVYLGDGVYATLENGDVTLDLRGQGEVAPNIVLEPAVLGTLVQQPEVITVLLTQQRFHDACLRGGYELVKVAS